MAEIAGIEYRDELTTVYNLSIPGSPTYFVGERGVWVHNCPLTHKIGQHRRAFASFFGEVPPNHEVHHIIPQRFRDVFGTDTIDNINNLVAVPLDIHRGPGNSVTRHWERWYRNIKDTLGREPTAAEVLQQSSVIEGIFGQHFLRP